MPAINVSPVSESVETRNVGSSRRKRSSALASLLASARRLGAIDNRITGSAATMFSNVIWQPGDVNVSPDAQSIPITAMISPAIADSISSR